MRAAVFAMPLFVVVLFGCSSDAGPETRGASARAKELVATALESWKGRHVAGLTVEGRPLRFQDEDAQAGLSLVSYELREPPAGWTEHVGLAATLSLRDAKGRRIVRHAEYLVTTRPELVIRRDD